VAATAEPIVRDVILRDGTTLRLRSPTPEDHDDIKAFFDGLSAESRYLRFHGFGRTDAVAASYAQADGDARVALLARHGDRIVAVAGYDRLREPGTAEVAFATADDFQGRGVATRMLEQLAEHAAARGIRRFDAEVLSDNRRMLGVFRSAGFGIEREGLGDEVRLALELRPSEELAERIARRDHVATVASLRHILAPAAVAVVGASSELGSVGGGIFANIVHGGFPGVAAPVNRSGAVVHSTRAAPRVSDLPETPELVVLAVPAAEVLAAARDAAGAGVKALVVVASGFSEASEDGARLEEELLEVVRSEGMRLVGPNSLGVISNAGVVRLHATIGPLEAPAGTVAISSQSGALGLALLGHAAARGMGVASFVSLGNRADVSTNDLLEYWEEDDGVAAITLYVESFGNPRRFSALAQRVSRRKPVLAVKGNRSPFATAGASSHTASALRGEAVVDALLRQAGVLRCASTEELFDAAELLAGQPLPRGGSVGIITNSGGLGTLAVDACATRGLAVPRLDDDAQRRLLDAVPGSDRTGNPVDMGIQATPEDYAAALDVLLADDGIDAVLAFYVQVSGTEPARILSAIDRGRAGTGKPVAGSVLGADGRPPHPPEGRVPNFRFPEACVAALAQAVQRRQWLSRPLGQQPALPGIDPAAAREALDSVIPAAGSVWLEPDVTERLLASHAIRVAPSRRCGAADDAVGAAAGVGGPVALKAYFPPPSHASDIDAVLLGLEGQNAVRAGWDELGRRVHGAGREWQGAVVQPLIPPGGDVLVGALADADLGPVLALGLGGRQAGLMGDVAFRLAAVTDVDADELIEAATPVAAQLAGYRGAPALDQPALRELILRFARLLEALPELVEVDLNPVRVLRQGCVVLDARMRAERRQPRPRVKTW